MHHRQPVQAIVDHQLLPTMESSIDVDPREEVISKIILLIYMILQHQPVQATVEPLLLYFKRDFLLCLVCSIKQHQPGPMLVSIS